MSFKGKKHSKKSRMKMSKNHANVAGSNHPLWGKRHSEKSKKKMSEALGGKNHPNWNGGIAKHPDGYISIWKPEHPFSTLAGYVLEHRLVAEKELGRYLKPAEEGHHRNGNRADNNWDNLFVFESKSDHTRYERFLRRK